ncbi:MAG: hypothetical protein ABJ218_13380, partial [Winogradskyella arenosi]
LGIIGIILFIILLFSLIKSLILPQYMIVVIFSIMMIYSFMTTIFSDIAIMITVCGLLQIKSKY